MKLLPPAIGKGGGGGRVERTSEGGEKRGKKSPLYVVPIIFLSYPFLLVQLREKEGSTERDFEKAKGKDKGGIKRKKKKRTSLLSFLLS